MSPIVREYTRVWYIRGPKLYKKPLTEKIVALVIFGHVHPFRCVYDTIKRNCAPKSRTKFSKKSAMSR